MTTKAELEHLADLLCEAARLVHTNDLEEASRTLREATKFAHDNSIPFRTIDFIPAGTFPTSTQWNEMTRREQEEMCQERSWQYSDSCTDLYYSDVVERAAGLHNY